MGTPFFLMDVLAVLMDVPRIAGGGPLFLRDARFFPKDAPFLSMDVLFFLVDGPLFAGGCPLFLRDATFLLMDAPFFPRDVHGNAGDAPFSFPASLESFRAGVFGSKGRRTRPPGPPPERGAGKSTGRRCCLCSGPF